MDTGDYWERYRGGSPRMQGTHLKVLVEDEAVKARDLLVAAVNADRALRKQWYLEQLADLLGVRLPEHDPGLAP